MVFLGSLILFLVKWKKLVIFENMGLFRLTPSPHFRFRLYRNTLRDFFGFLSSSYGRPIQCAPKDSRTLEQLRSSPSLLLTAHFHNWEMMGGWLVSQRVRLLSIAQPLASRWAQALLDKLRSRISSPTLSQDLWPQSLAHLRQGGCLAFLWDQYSPLARDTSPLLGCPAPMNPLPPLLQRRMSLPVYFAVLLPSGHFRLWQLVRANTAISPEALARRYHRFLGALIRRYPDYWYGFYHRRFKNLTLYGPKESLFHVKHGGFGSPWFHVKRSHPKCTPPIEIQKVYDTFTGPRKTD